MEYKTPLEILLEVFGYAKFKGERQQIIETIQAGEHALVLMPTGGGKSICYQIPALLNNGIAIVIETATDNPTRTVANIRSYLTRHGGSLGTSGCLQFLFDHKCVFKIAPKEGVSLEDLELELIDFGVDELVEDEDSIILYGEFQSYSSIQKYLEENGFEIESAEFERIPNDTKEVTEEQRASIEKLLEKFEDDEDVQNVFHNMKEADDEE